MQNILNKKKTYFIAEAGVNHNGSFNEIKKLILNAKKCGADAVKFQSFKTDEFLSTNKSTYKVKSNKIKDIYKMFKKIEFQDTWYSKIYNICKKVDIEFLTSVADINSAKIYFKYNNIVKIASEDIINYPLLEFLGKQKKKIIILSTGMASENEIKKAIGILKDNKIILMHCVSLYPTELSEINLNRILELKKKFKVEVGFSDHTIGMEALIMAKSIGCRVYEKHFTINKNKKGPDHFLSLDPNETKKIVYIIKNYKEIFNDGLINPKTKEKEIALNTRRVIVANKEIKKGEIFSKDKIWLRRAGKGIHPKFLNEILGKKSNKDYSFNEKIILKKYL